MVESLVEFNIPHVSINSASKEAWEKGKKSLLHGGGNVSINSASKEAWE